ncbi:hypothetical protein BKA64DRAFT_664337 [Cadophora sp. MPI-SDFR-AT-0126]|nr:hypothetical protein BKA64DRAFT_664337 [Leotiomycetes sp. MPI-SDFR-AT-0126]
MASLPVIDVLYLFPLLVSSRPLSHRIIPIPFSTLPYPAAKCFLRVILSFPPLSSRIQHPRSALFLPRIAIAPV